MDEKISKVTGHDAVHIVQTLYAWHLRLAKDRSEKCRFWQKIGRKNVGFWQKIGRKNVGFWQKIGRKNVYLHSIGW